MENLAIPQYIEYSSKGYIKALLYKISNMIFISVYSSGKKDLIKAESDTINIRTYIGNKTTKTSFSSITGNNGTVGQLVLDGGIISVVATGNNGLAHSYFGSIFGEII